MALLAEAFARKSASTLDIFREIYGGRLTNTGKTVNVETAIGVAALPLGAAVEIELIAEAN